MTYYDEDAVATARQDAHTALQRLFVAMYGPGILTDWMVTGECVTDEDDKKLIIALSDGISAWSLRGMSYMSSRMVHELTN